MPSQHTRRTALAGGLAVLTALALAAPLVAQINPAIDTLTIRIWPEFDRPEALVFYVGQAAADLPASLTFTIPPTGRIHAVADQLPDGRLANATFTFQGNTLTMASPNGTFHVEFYDSALRFDGEKRSYRLAWSGPHPVNRLIWEVQQPAGASNLSVSPGESTLSADDFGLPLYRVETGAVPAGETASIEVRYTKPTGALTADLLRTSLQPTIQPPPRMQGLPNTVFLIVMGAIIAALAGVAGYYYSESRRAAARDGRATLARETAPELAPGATPQTAPEAPPPGLGALAEELALTERELEVLRLVAEGLSNREIGRRLGISYRTVGRHRENIMRKLGLHSRTELVKHAIRIGLIDLGAEDG